MAGMTIKELEDALETAKVQMAKVDSEYVNYDHRGHLFDYDIDYVKFINNIAYVIKEGTRKGLDFKNQGR